MARLTLMSTTVDEFLGAMAAMSAGRVIYIRYGLENFRYSRLDMILMFTVTSIPANQMVEPGTKVML